MADGSQLPLLAGGTQSLLWSASEIATLRATYCSGGVHAAREALPDRTPAAIYMKALKLKLRSPRIKATERRSYPVVPELDDDIRRAHARSAGRGCWSEIARRWGRPQWYVSRRAADLGLSLPRNHSGNWSEAELELLHATAHATAARAAKQFKKAGFRRTPHAIQIKRHQLGCRRGQSGIYSAQVLADMLGCSANHVRRQVRAGALRAKRDQGDLDLYLISERDVRTWLIAKPCAIDLRHLPPGNQPWLINVLAGHYLHD